MFFAVGFKGVYGNSRSLYVVRKVIVNVANVYEKRHGPSS